MFLFLKFEFALLRNAKVKEWPFSLILDIDYKIRE